MEKLLGVPEIMARYGCCRQTASKRMHEMRHMEKPLMVTETAVKQWEQRKMNVQEVVKLYEIPRRRA